LPQNDPMLSLSEENYLKAIYHLQGDNEISVSTNDLSKFVNNKASSVTDMLKKLSEKSLVIYKKYQGVSLSEEGKRTALKIIRKHRLWEVFLVEKLNFKWNEVHEVAEQLEHIKSEKLTDELDKFLEYPKRDPHGDPIPNKNGDFEAFNKTLLSELEPEESGICVGVRDTSDHFLAYLDKRKIALGKRLTVKEKEDYDKSMLIAFDDQEISISEHIAQNLFIKV